MRKLLVLPVLVLSLLGLAACDTPPAEDAGTTAPAEEPATAPAEEPADTTTGE